ncbi:OmpA family protein [Sphingorhabdus buctiana]|uniref:OmpA family protein n=1 Tax=Sphingorhabdus buctiana TaxID=1508805 RepID=A0ABW4MGJ3_9SPHN
MKKKLLAAGGIALTMFSGGTAYAQASPRSPLNDLGMSELRSELRTRHDAAVAMTQDSNVVRSTDSKFQWASEAKAWCGIAVGYAKSSTKDEESINKCDAFYARMNAAPPPPPAAPYVPPPAPPEPACTASRATEVFFDWNVDMPAGEAETTLAAIAQNRTQCGWGPLTITGHADKSGGDAYNAKLSQRRADNIAAALERLGVPRGDMTVVAKGEGQPKVDTADGVREPANRRVEILAQERGN